MYAQDLTFVFAQNLFPSTSNSIFKIEGKIFVKIFIFVENGSVFLKFQKKVQND